MRIRTTGLVVKESEKKPLSVSHRALLLFLFSPRRERKKNLCKSTLRCSIYTIYVEDQQNNRMASLTVPSVIPCAGTVKTK